MHISEGNSAEQTGIDQARILVAELEEWRAPAPAATSGSAADKVEEENQTAMSRTLHRNLKEVMRKTQIVEEVSQG